MSNHAHLLVTPSEASPGHYAMGEQNPLITEHRSYLALGETSAERKIIY
jgi:hypothetical protein